MSDTTLPELPPLDPQEMLGYAAIRYVEGWPENYVQQYATEYAIAAIAAERARAAAPAGEAQVAELKALLGMCRDVFDDWKADSGDIGSIARLYIGAIDAALAEAAPPTQQQGDKQP